jgi:septal ring factor EnvC (AmiA/AmiB activator)
MSKKGRKKRTGHYCRICERYRPNEKFSGKGHAIHVCKKCASLPSEERQLIEERQEIEGFLSQSNISEKNLARLESLTASQNPEIAVLAGLVLEVGRAYPHKRKRIRRLARDRKDLLDQLEEIGLIAECPWSF